MSLTKSQLKKLIKNEIRTYEQQQLNEGVMDFFGSLLGSGADAVLDRFKSTAASWLLNRLGIETDGLLGQALVNVFENLELSELWSLIRGDRSRCPLIARELLEAFSETLLEQLPEVLGIEADGWFTGVVREMITNYIVRNNQIIARIAESICSIDVGEIFQSSGATEQQTNQLEQALGGTQNTSTASFNSLPTSQAEQVQEATRRLNRILLEEKRIKNQK